MQAIRQAACLLALSLAVTHACASNVILQIGDLDGDYRDLAIPADYGSYTRQYDTGVLYTQGRSSAREHWPFVQPGPVDAWAGARRHTHRIAFHLSSPLPRYARLTLALVSTHNVMPPVLQLALNGRSARIQLQPGTGDDALKQASAGRPQQIVSLVPGSALKTGRNEMVITLVSGSWVLYDAIRLEALDESESAALSLTADPHQIERLELQQTPFFVRRKGRLRQLMTLRVYTPVALQTMPLTLTAPGLRRRARLTTDLTGTAETALDVEPVETTGEMNVVVSTAGRTYTARCPVTPSRRWTIYLLASAHVDVGYTDWQPRVIDGHNRNTRLAIDLASRYPHFIWNTEVGWVTENALNSLEAADRERLGSLARQGRIGAPALYGNMLTGLCSHEELIRALGLAYGISESHDIPFDFAMSTDVPSHVATLPSVLAGSGIRYFAAGLNLYRASGFDKLFNHSPFYWQGLDGARVLTWLAPGYAAASGLGLDQGMEQAAGRIRQFAAGYDRPDYPYDAILAFGAYGDNASLSESLPRSVDEWNRRYVYPKLVFCRGPEFFQHIERQAGDRIPVISGCGGVYWEDGAASTAHEVSMVRQAKEMLLQAEALFAYCWWTGRADWPARRFREAWRQIVLFDEHTWGAAGSITDPYGEQTRKQWAYKRLFAVCALTQARALWYDAKQAAGLQSAPLSSSSSTGNRQSLSVNTPATVESRHYRLTVDPAIPAVTSLYDKELQRELLDNTAPWPLNTYIYVEGQGASLHTRDANVVQVHGWVVKKDDYSELTIEALDAHGARLTSTYRLPEAEKRLEITNRLDKPAVLSKEAGYFSFPFRMDAPQFHVSLPNGMVNPRIGMLEGGCTSWFAVQDFVSVHDDSACVIWTPIDSPLVTLNGLHREGQSADIAGLAPAGGPPCYASGHLYAYVFNNYWDTNYRAEQGGPMLFRFWITSRALFSAAESAAIGRYAMASATDTEAVMLDSDVGRRGQSPFVSVDSNSVLIQAVKRADHRDALVIRLRETSGEPVQTLLRLPEHHGEVWQCDLMERPVSRIASSDGSPTILLPANSLTTIAVDRPVQRRR